MTITIGKKYLLDTNILVYSQDKKSSKNKRALEIIDELELNTENIFLTVNNLLEYSAVLTRFYKIPKKKISEDIRLFTEHPIFRIIYPSEAVTQKFINLMENNPKLYVYDLYLAAYMQVFGIETIITDDKDFEEIKGIEVINPF